MEIKDYPNTERLYTLSDGDAFYSSLPREYIEYLLFTVPNIKLPEIKEIFRNCTDGTLQIFAISSLQYRLFQSCQEHETPLKMDMSVYEYKCDLENHPNLYVPCFSYMEGNNESFCTQTEDVLSEENIDRFVSLIDNLLDYLDAKEYHIGLLSDNCEKYNNYFSSLKKRLKHYNVELIYDNVDMSNFSWDDSVFNTVTVLIDMVSNKERINNVLNSFFTLGGESGSDYICSRVVYISLFHQNETRYLYLLEKEWIKTERLPYYIFPLWIYYPTSITKDIDEHDWWVRKLIWNFKSDSDKILYEEKEKADKEVIKEVKSTLICSFGDIFNDFTLFCVPSSTKEKYHKRFERFSENLCKDTGMKNGFNHIKYICDSDAKHKGGLGMPYVEFNKIFFKNKSIIMFDDIYTTGDSMAYYANILMSLGAKVIAGITIGITQKDKWLENAKYGGSKGLYDYYSMNIW